jgi:hypothetical protein
VIAPYNQISNGLYDHDIRGSLAMKCPRHKYDLSLFCCDCVTLACKNCEPVSHRGHSLEPVDAALARLKPECQSFVLGLRKRVPALTEYQAFLEAQLTRMKEEKGKLEERVNAQAQAIHAMVDQFTDALLQNLNETFQQEEEEIRSRQKDMTTAQKSLESNAQFLGHLLAVGSASEVLELHPVVMGRLKQLINLRPHTLTHRLAPIFTPGPANTQNMRIMFGTVDIDKVTYSSSV